MSIEEKFQAAVNVIKGLPKDGPYQPSNEMALKFYGLYKQATEGPCQIPKPSFYQLVAGYKWQAWKAVGNISKEEAMDRYVTELKMIVETMSYSADVATFMEALGPFYEYVDIPGNNNDTKCIKGQAEPDDTSEEGDDMAEDPLLEVKSHEDLPTNGSEEKQKPSNESDDGGSVGISEVVVNSGFSSVLQDCNGRVPYRNGHLPSHVMGNGVVSKAFFMASPLTAAEEDYDQQHCHRQQQQQQLQQKSLNGAMISSVSDTDSDEEYSEPAESLDFCSGSGGVPTHGLTQVEDGNLSPERLANLGVDEKIQLDGSQYRSSATNCFVVSGDSIDQHSFSNGTSYTAEQTCEKNGQCIDQVTTTVPQRSSSAVFSNTNGCLQMSSFLNSSANSGQVSLSGAGHQNHVTNTSSGQEVALVYSVEMVQALQQMQAELSSLTRCLDAHLSDISRELAAAREPMSALQNQNNKEMSATSSGDLRRRRRWWPPVPELSRLSTAWLLLWPVFVHLAIKLLGAGMAMRRKNK